MSIKQNILSLETHRQQLKYSMIWIFLFSVVHESYAIATDRNGINSNSATTNTNSNFIRILAVVPTAQGDTALLPTWVQGETILPGAYLAMKEINELPDLLKGYNLEVIPVTVPMCKLDEGVVQFVKELQLDENNILGVVGSFCHSITELIYKLVQRKAFDVIPIFATSVPALERYHVSRLHYSILSPLSIAKAAVRLMQQVKWNNIAVVSSQNINNIQARNTFINETKAFGIDVALTSEVSPFTHQSSLEFLRELRTLGVKIIVAFVSPSEGVQLICSAYYNGFKWPDYAWIFTEIIQIESLQRSPFCSRNTESIAINNMIFLDQQLRPPNDFDILPSGLNYRVYQESYLDQFKQSSFSFNLSNLYANVLYDSIWTFALTLNRSLGLLEEKNLSIINFKRTERDILFDVLEEQLSKLAFQGATGFLNFSQNNAALQTSVDLFQFQSRQNVPIGSYNMTLDQLLLNTTALGDIPTSTLNRIYVHYPKALTAILEIIVASCFMWTIVSMCLFVYHRKQPSIKATSYILSLCVFVGCYLLLTSSLVNTITNSVRTRESLQAFVCMLDVYLISIGLDIIFATVITKTLRIYYIFHKFGKVSQICSDLCLFLLIVLIVSVRIVFLIFWTTLDVSYVFEAETFISENIPPYILISEECRSEYLSIWLGLSFGYYVLLMLVMVILASLTRKIKRPDFKDSKKINTLIFALIFTLSICMPLWLFLRQIGASVPGRLSYTIGTILTPVLCQAFLISPKILPLILPSRFHLSKLSCEGSSKYSNGNKLISYKV